MMKNGTNVVAKFNRCLSFTLADGTVIDVKVLGEKADAAVAAKRLLDALSK
jgi:hypothetical protein